MTVTDLDPQAMAPSGPRVGAPAGRSSAATTSHSEADAHAGGAGVAAPSDPQAVPHAAPVLQSPAGRPSPHLAKDRALTSEESSGGASLVEPGPATRVPTPRPPAPGGFDELRVLAESYRDAQDVRIRIENRLRSGTIPPDLADSILTEQKRVEHMIGLAMRRQFRRCAPDIHTWVKNTVGIGEHLMARLLGTIGHPVIATPHHWEGEGAERVLVADPPFERNVAKLWAYCGHGDPTRRKAKGMTADQAMALGSPQAKMIVHLLAESAMKCAGSTTDQGALDTRSVPVRRRSPYRDTYELARARYATRDDWTPAHQHNAALRIVGKEILRDLWKAAQ